MTHEQCELVSAWATLAAAVIAFLTVLVAVLAMWFSGKDAREARDQQSAQAKDDREQQRKIFQANVMSACMQEYFSIRNEAAKELRGLTAHATPADKEAVCRRYSERVYGLHFEQYHLFRQGAIPCHVYAIWLKSLFDEMKNPAKRPHTQYPPLDLTEYTAKDPEEDFHQFFDQVQKAGSHKQIEHLVKREKEKGGYD